MNKFCTSIEQSKKLIELGIDVNTADMEWLACHLLSGTTQWRVNCYPKIYSYQDPEIIPAWSLSVLLGLMLTDDKKDDYYADTESHSDYYTVSYRNWWDGCIHSEYSEESLLDAAFEMICWLKENGKI